MGRKVHWPGLLTHVDINLNLKTKTKKLKLVKRMEKENEFKN